MKRKYCESESGFCVKFFGADDIDASTLAVSLNDMVGTVKDITNETTPDAYAKLNVTSTRTGCFEINLSTVIHYIPTLLTRENVEVASNVLLIFLNAILIKQHLKGKPPKEIRSDGDKSTVLNQLGEKFKTTRNISKTFFGSPKIDNRITNIFVALNADEKRDDVLIESDDKKISVTVNKREFEDMGTKVVEDMQDINEIYSDTIGVSLLLKKPDLLGRSRWGFIFNKAIEAEIQDYDWLERVQKGEIRDLYSGVRIPVKLLIEVELDEFKNPIGEPKYTVLKVTGEIIKPTQQQTLFDL